MRQSFLCLSFIVIFCTQVCAESVENISPIEEEFQGRPPLGQGSLYSFLFELYKISFWAQNRECAETMSCDMAIQTVQNWGADKKQLVDKSLEKITHYNPSLAPETINSYRKELERLYPERLESGDVVQIVYKKKEGYTDFYHRTKNQEKQIFKGRVYDEKFTQSFFSIWLHPQTTYSVLREALLGG